MVRFSSVWVAVRPTFAFNHVDGALCKWIHWFDTNSNLNGHALVKYYSSVRTEKSSAMLIWRGCLNGDVFPICLFTSSIHWTDSIFSGFWLSQLTSIDHHTVKTIFLDTYLRILVDFMYFTAKTLCCERNNFHEFAIANQQTINTLITTCISPLKV